MNPDNFNSYQRKSQTQAVPNPPLAGFSLKSSLQGQYLITRQPKSTGAALAYVLCYKGMHDQKVTWKQEWKAVLCQWQPERKQTQASKAGGKGVGIKPTTSSWKNTPIFSELTFYPKMAGTLFLPHLQITRQVSLISPGKEKKKGKKKSHNKVIQHDPFPTCVQLTAASLLFHLLCHRQMEN